MPAQLTPYQWFASLLRDESPLYSDLIAGTPEDELWQVGAENGVLVLANHKLGTSEAKSSLSKTFCERLKNHATNAAASDLAQEHELRLVFDIFSRAEIPFLLIKGTPLSYTDYPLPYLRSRSDTDILFANKEDAEKAWHQLKGSGYTRPNAVSGEFVSHEFSCYKKDSIGVGHTLDMHWKLSNRQFFARAFSFTELADASVTIADLGEQTKALGPVHALMLACMHRIAHKPEGTENRLIWLYDIQLLTAKFSEEQWQQFVTLAEEKKLCGICLDGLQQTARTFNTDIPLDVIRQLKEAARHEKQSTKMGDSRLSLEISNLRALPGWKERMGLIKERVFPDTKYMMEKYDTRHRMLLPYLYLKRAVGGVFKVFR